MRKINFIVVHCTATPAGQDMTVMELEQWHKSHGLGAMGYHFVIGLDGYLQFGLPIDKIGKHVKGLNRCSIGVSYVGGRDVMGKPADTRTEAQKETIKRLIDYLKAEFPESRVVAHSDIGGKDCPCFDAAKEHN